ncbi:hypothetical protein thsps21_04960 [Pseudomonas sp. No.21]|nr:hypothetical protein TUM20249_61720 [Pseudomonas tohonis]
MGSAAPRPKREALLSTRILVGPGVMEATKANSRKGSSCSMVSPRNEGEARGNGASARAPVKTSPMVTAAPGSVWKL